MSTATPDESSAPAPEPSPPQPGSTSAQRTSPLTAGELDRLLSKTRVKDVYGYGATTVATLFLTLVIIGTRGCGGGTAPPPPALMDKPLGETTVQELLTVTRDLAETSKTLDKFLKLDERLKEVERRIPQQQIPASPGAAGASGTP